jgi:hypothetical protein
VRPAWPGTAHSVADCDGAVHSDDLPVRLGCGQTQVSMTDLSRSCAIIILGVSAGLGLSTSTGEAVSESASVACKTALRTCRRHRDSPRPGALQAWTSAISQRPKIQAGVFSVEINASDAQDPNKPDVATQATQATHFSSVLNCGGAPTDSTTGVVSGAGDQHGGGAPS